MKNHFLTKAASYLIIGFALVAMLTTSCKKEGEEEEEQLGNGYKITFKVDGVAKEFADEDFPPFGIIYESGWASFGATGRASSVGMQVYDTKAIVEKEYSGYVVTQANPHNTVVGAVVSFADSQLNYSTQSITSPNVRVKITKITSDSVSGEFSGTLKSQNGKPDIKISDGKFYVQRRTPTN